MWIIVFNRTEERQNVVRSYIFIPFAQQGFNLATKIPGDGYNFLEEASPRLPVTLNYMMSGSVVKRSPGLVVDLYKQPKHAPST
jgi:hypothetical protein